MKKLRVLPMLLVLGLFIISCDGEDGDIGPIGPAGINGIDGQDGVDGQDGADARPPQGLLPVGLFVNVWNSFDIEDRRVNRNPGDIGVGTAQLIKDENDHFFYMLSSFTTSDSANTEYEVYTTVAGAALGTQNGFTTSERPRQVMTLDGSAPLTITQSEDRIYIPVTTPPGPAEDTRRMFDWLLLYPVGGDIDQPGIVADLDAQDLLPRRQIWNSFEIEDRTADAPAPAVTGNGFARIVTNEDQGRTRFWINLSGFEGINAPINRGGGSIVAERFAVFLTVAGAPLGNQINFAGEEPVFVGFVEANGAQYIPMTLGTVADLDAANGRNIAFNLNNANVALNADGYILPQRASGGQNRWYDWVVLMPIDAQGIRPITYGGFASDLDRDNELSQNQRQK